MRRMDYTISDRMCWSFRDATRRLGPEKWLFAGLLFLSSFSLGAQPGPNCTHINASIGVDDYARVTVGEIVTNIGLVGNVNVEITGPYGQRIYTATNVNGAYEISLNACPYINSQLKVNITAVANGGTCWSYLTFKQGNGPTIEGRNMTLYCYDSIVLWNPTHIEYPLPPLTADLPCREQDIEADYVADWVVPYDCVEPGTALADTVKIIYREYEAFDKEGRRGVGYDTFYVFRLPRISMMNTYCRERDTTYCGVGKVGPYLILNDLYTDEEEQMDEDFCDTICFLTDYLDPKCGVGVNIKKVHFQDQGCLTQTKYIIDLKQDCYGQDQILETTCQLPTDPPNGLDSIAPGYWRCEFWVIDLDTVPPVVDCKFPKSDPSLITGPFGDTLLVPSSTHECAAYSYLPPVYVRDDWSGIKYVKARIEGITTLVFQPGPTYNTDFCYVSHKQVKIPHGLPVPVIYEVYDSCHNIGYDTCYLKVKDLTKPVPVCDKGVIVGLSSKKVWVEASTFDEGSWDNCAINLMLARRTDWYKDKACVDLCNDTSLVCVGEHYDSIWIANLETDKHVDPVEAHYYKIMKWLKEDERECAEILWNAWTFDLMKHATLKCADHPYPVDEQYFKKLLLEANCYERFEGVNELTHELIDMWHQIGGGWSDAVPFSCDDACQEVQVELLVMDYWCNWAKCWTWVLVEDKTPIQIVKELAPEVEITCKAYNDPLYKFTYFNNNQNVSIEYIVEQAKTGSQSALRAIDSVFGGYEKVWRDEYGNVPPQKRGNYTNRICQCETITEKVKIYDEHLGYIWKDISYDTCFYRNQLLSPFYGQVVVNCSEAVQCNQTVWCEFDHCGQGYIFRKWEFVVGCVPEYEHWSGKLSKPHLDTIVRKQVIWVGNDCELEKGMFWKPDEHVYVQSCGMKYDEAGNVTGDLDPAVLGEPKYHFDPDCRIVGIAHEDKVFKVINGNDACYKVIRKWFFMDWCHLGGKPQDKYWYLDPYYQGKILKWEQKIIVQDTVAPVCEFENDLGQVNPTGCYYDLNQKVIVKDVCGASSYYYILTVGSNQTLVKEGSEDLDGDTSFVIKVDDLTTGNYTLKVRVTDECGNESYCIDQFTVLDSKKPTAICITSLTIELTPTDIDDDDVIDTAIATIWANEFNSSSQPGCGRPLDQLFYYIELIDGVNDDVLNRGTEDLPYLTVGCEHVGVQSVRLWVWDGITGATDYCDVLLIVQNNMGGCNVASTTNTITGKVLNELSKSIQQVNVRAELENGQLLEYLTSTDGAYSFATKFGQKVVVRPYKDISDMNGISTFDLVKIQKHILGLEMLPSKYREIAADANADGKVSPLDLVHLRRLILGKVDHLPENTSWRFFSTVNQAERYVINPFNQSMKLDWIGVKIGDVNLDNDPARSINRTSSDALVFRTEDLQMTAGNQYRIVIEADHFQHVTGYQYTLSIDPQAVTITGLDLDDAIDLTDEHFALNNRHRGLISTSWNTADPLSVVKGKALYSIIIEANRVVRLSDVMTINSAITTAEGYTSDGDVMYVALNFNDQISNVDEFRLYQNEPNPFNESTVIGFQIPERSEAKLTIFDVTGRVIHQQSGSYTKGYHEVFLDREKLNVTGVLYYQLDTDVYTATKKMIHVR